jgi:flagellar motor switch/type III secretory pathway protein FliN
LFKITSETYREHSSPVEVISPTRPPPFVDLKVRIVVELAVLGVELGALLKVTIIRTQIRALVEWSRVLALIANFRL